MKSIAVLAFSAFALIVAAGCSTTSYQPTTSDQPRPSYQLAPCNGLDTPSPCRMRGHVHGEVLENLGIADHDYYKDIEIGVALAGGGSKAAPFGMGVLAGLHDSGVLKRTQAIASVSGGSYAAYYYFNRLIQRARNEIPAELASDEALFGDCVRRAQNNQHYPPSVEQCALWNPRAPVVHKHHLQQTWVRCHQDITAEPECSFLPTTRDIPQTVRSFTGLLAASVLTAPFHHVANTVFDWGYNLSPTRGAYYHGIGVTYGAFPRAVSAFTYRYDGTHIDDPCVDFIKECQWRGYAAFPREYSFEDLRALYAKTKPPMWIISATAVKNRDFRSWGYDSVPNLDLDVWEFTPFSYGSKRYGWVRGHYPDKEFSILDAVTASAAFLDANQQAFQKAEIRGPTALLQHTLNLNWGVDIPNYNVSDTRRELRKLFPFPLYFLVRGPAHPEPHVVPDLSGDESSDGSVFIRLADGGNSDNFGAFNLLRRNARNIVIADSGQDDKGAMLDLLRVCAQTRFHLGRHFSLPGLEGFDDACEKWAQPANVHLADYDPRVRWSIGAWKHPVLVGCVTSGGGCESAGPGDTRIYLIKPALDRAAFNKNQAIPPEPSDEPWRDRRTLGLRTCTDLQDKAERDARVGLARTDLPCEVAAYLAENTRQVRKFPQNGTVTITLNSSSSVYAAYRDLGRFYAQFAGWLLDPAHAHQRFKDVLEIQSQPENKQPAHVLPGVKEQVDW